MREDRVRSKGPQILSGWKEIANYMGKGVRTVQRYERLFGLPVRRPAGKACGSVVATKAEIDAWVGASPIREGLQLVRPATEFSATTWSNVQAGLAKMRELAQQMQELRTELRSSVILLRQTISNVQYGLDGGQSPRQTQKLEAENLELQSRNLLARISGDLAGRKVS
jgi:hypothetical protein